ncbi:MAG: 6-phospho-3-hexuloisomerase [Thermoplasmatota archaeon]
MSNNQLYKKSHEYIQFKLTDTLGNISSSDVDKVVSLFFKAKRIFVYGAGRSGLVAKAFAIRLVHLGFQTFVIGETIGAPVKKKDLVFIVTGSGETIPSVMTAEIAHNIGAKVVVVTGIKDAKIVRFADVCLFLYVSCDDDKRRQLAPLGTLFEASAWILLDSIVAALMKNKGETEESMHSRHATLE